MAPAAAAATAVAASGAGQRGYLDRQVHRSGDRNGEQ